MIHVRRQPYKLTSHRRRYVVIVIQWFPHPHKHNVPDSFHPVGVNLTQEARGRRKNGDWGLGEEMRVEREKKVGGSAGERGVVSINEEGFRRFRSLLPLLHLLTLTQVVSLGCSAIGGTLCGRPRKTKESELYPLPYQLFQDLPRRQVTRQTHCSRRAEGAAHLAPHLRGDTQCRPRLGASHLHHTHPCACLAAAILWVTTPTQHVRGAIAKGTFTRPFAAAATTSTSTSTPATTAATAVAHDDGLNEVPILEANQQLRRLPVRAVLSFDLEEECSGGRSLE